MISVELHEVSLDEDPVYEALSYEWGEKSGSIPIQCGTHCLLVTPNLWEAMQRLRLKDEKRTLWIDAVCINQRDRVEQSQQVMLMRRIYQEATAVTMWIGKENENRKTPEGFEKIIALSGIWDDLCHLPAWSLVNYLEDNVAAINASDFLSKLAPLFVENDDIEEGYYVLDDLFERNYFTRGWIVQEMVLGMRTGIVICGAQKCLWPQWQKALWVMNLVTFMNNNPSSFPPNDIVSQSALSIGLTMQKSLLEGLFSQVNVDAIRPGTQHADVASSWDLAIAIPLMASFQTTNPRDKVYAALGFIRSQQRHGLVPDYNLSVQEVYLQAAHRIVLDSGPTVVFDSSLSRPMDKTTPKLPSWVPDWTKAPKGRVRCRQFMEFPILNTVELADPKLAGASLFLDGCVCDRVSNRFHVDMRDTDAIYQCLKTLAETLAASRGAGGIFDHYPLASATDADSGHEEVSYLHAFWLAITFCSYEDMSHSRNREAISYLAWQLVGDMEHLKEYLPESLQEGVQEWATKRETEGGRFDLQVCSQLHGSVENEFACDLVLTGRGFLGVTNSLKAMEAESLVVVKLGGVSELRLLLQRQDPKSSGTYYEYVDVLEIVDLDEVMGSIGGLQRERLEVR